LAPPRDSRDKVGNFHGDVVRASYRQPDGCQGEQGNSNPEAGRQTQTRQVRRTNGSGVIEAYQAHGILHLLDDERKLIEFRVPGCDRRHSLCRPREPPLRL
jgi:hypothetical protein